PVVVATGSQTLAETLDLSAHATSKGADGLLVVTPYYVRPPQRGLVAYFSEVASRTPLPLLLYHIPGRAAVGVTVDTLSAIAETADNFVGIKHASADLSLITETLLKLGPDFRIFVGLEELSFPMMALGACGMVNAVSNIAPREVVALYDAVISDSIKEARRLHQQLFELNQAIFFDTNPIPLKYMMWRLGILPNDTHRLPMTPPTPEVAQRLDQVLQRAGLIPESSLKTVN
ncbi:MAG: dihydrodipicolinate synthase family protein, partial [Ilumatobacteraceae bacterium]